MRGFQLFATFVGCLDISKISVQPCSKTLVSLLKCHTDHGYRLPLNRRWNPWEKWLRPSLSGGSPAGTSRSNNYEGKSTLKESEYTLEENRITAIRNGVNMEGELFGGEGICYLQGEDLHMEPCSLHASSHTDTDQTMEGFVIAELKRRRMEDLLPFENQLPRCSINDLYGGYWPTDPPRSMNI